MRRRRRRSSITSVKHACVLAGYGLDQFYTARASDLSEIVQYLDGKSEEEAVEVVWSLCNRHGSQVIEAVRRMRESLRAAGIQPPDGSAMHMIDEEAHARELQPMSERSGNPPFEVFFSYSHRDEKLRTSSRITCGSSNVRGRFRAGMIVGSVQARSGRARSTLT